MKDEAKDLNDEVYYYYEWNTNGNHLIIKTLDDDFSNTDKHYSKVEIVKVFDEDYCVGETYYWRSNSEWKPVPNPDAIQQNKRHKHADLIIAWANGAEIEFQHATGNWYGVPSHPYWSEGVEFRIKPAKPKDIVKTMFVEVDPCLDNAYDKYNLKLTFDGETKKLVKSEVIDN